MIPSGIESTTLQGCEILGVGAELAAAPSAPLLGGSLSELI
jgi:hypothetical protein